MSRECGPKIGRVLVLEGVRGVATNVIEQNKKSRKKWMVNIKEDFKKRNCVTQPVAEYVRDKTQWRKFIHEATSYKTRE